RRKLMDSFRVVGQVQAGPESDLQHVAVGTGEQLSPVPSQERLVQEEVAKAWDNYLREEAHGRLLPCLARAGPFVAILLSCRPDEATDGGAACFRCFFVVGPVAVCLK